MSDPIRLGDIELWPPIVLAPMAGVTDYPFRALCRRFAHEGASTLAQRHAGTTPGLFVSEMITARPLVEGDRKTLKLASFGPDESPRSLQLYGVDPVHVGLAVERLVGEGLIDHLDMNFGCPVAKITRRGGGSAIPAKPRLLAKIVRAAVQAAGHVPVTIKFRKGLDDRLLTYREAGRIGQEEGCAAVGLHARTALQFYEDGADWDAIAELASTLTIPVFGNGDIWEAHDARRMMAQTGCAGVIIGRGCLGRPWLFAELVELLGGGRPRAAPAFGTVAAIMREHAAAMVEWMGHEGAALRAFRKHAGWYTKGWFESPRSPADAGPSRERFRGGTMLRERLMHIDDLDSLDVLLASADPDEPFPAHALRAVRGKRGRLHKIVLPAAYLDELDDDRPPGPDAEQLSSGG